MAADADLPRARVEHEPNRPGLTRQIGVEVDDVRPGHGGMLARAARSELRQVSGVVHGGVPATLPDHAVGTASAPALPPDRVAVKADVRTAYLAPVASDGAEPSGVRSGSTRCVVAADRRTSGAGAAAVARPTVTRWVVPVPPLPVPAAAGLPPYGMV